MPRWGRSATGYWPGRLGSCGARPPGYFYLEYRLSQIIFGSVCSGIEAASAAWYPLGWRAAWLAEIDPFASIVLKYHHPTVPNLGDMTLIAAKVRSRLVAAPDVLVGGTPCQAYSVAGLRNSLDDARGQLTLSFVGLANAIDDTRAADGDEPCIIVWENVPGVLNTKDNAFGCFLGGLAGEDCALVAPGGKWPNAGIVYGPQRTVAWRVTDAQFFGVAQRRRRVFVIASAREGFDPGEVLFEFDGLRRDSAPSREPGQETAGTLASRATGGGFPGTDEAAAGYVQPVGGFQRPGVTATLDASYGRLQGCSGQDANHGRSHANGGGQLAVCITGDVTHCLKADGFDASEDGTGTGRGQPIVAVALRGRDGGATAELGDDIGFTLRAGGGGDKPHVLAPVSERDVRYAYYSEDYAHDRLTDPAGVNPALTRSTTSSGNLNVFTGMAVRRLIPRECERLQAFPDDHTLVPVKKAKRRSKQFDYTVIDGELWQLAADGPRYKALGNSMCVFNMRWLGERIDLHLTNPYGDLL